MRPGIYNKGALERLSTPEQLDQLVRITSPQSWLSLVVLLLLTLAVVVWSAFGRVTTRVQAEGILVGGGVVDVIPLSTGAMTRLLVEVGDEVEEGDLIAQLSQSELERQLANARSRLVELRDALRQLESFGFQDQRLQESFIEQQRQALERQIRSAQERNEYLDAQLASEETLQSQGLITLRQVEATRQALSLGREEVERARSELTQLSSRELTARFDRTQQLELAVQRIRDAERLESTLEAELAIGSRILAPARGRVLEVMAAEGALVTPGVPILKIGRTAGMGEGLHAILYVSTADGKKVANAMQVRVAPATVKPEEHGFIVARVLRVAEFPATTQGMMYVLKNDQLVYRLAATGAPFEVVAELETDDAAPSGFRWTSRGGPDQSIQGGTPVTAWIEIEVRRPITLVVPALRRLLIPRPRGTLAGGGR